MLCRFAFLAIPPLPSIDSAAGRPALFTNFVGTISESDFSSSYIIGFGSRLPDAGRRRIPPPTVKLEISRFPRKERACMPGSTTTPGRPSACAGALTRVAFRYTDSVGTQNQFSIAAQWLACTYPCRRFADTLTDACARLGADVVRYSFIAGTCTPYSLPVSRRTCVKTRKRSLTNSITSDSSHADCAIAHARARKCTASIGPEAFSHSLDPLPPLRP